jgi:pyridoxal phosphate enzyme (YggS family)
LNVCIQVNISGEQTKAGIGLDKLPILVHSIKQLPRLRLRGLMALPAPVSNFNEQRRAFRCLYDAFQDLNHKGADMDTLSMGTSSDFEAAIAEGATIVRIGTAIFGPRRS